MKDPKHKNEQKGLTDAELVKKYERGKIDFKEVVKSTLEKPSEPRIFKSKTPVDKKPDEDQKAEN